MHPCCQTFGHPILEPHLLPTGESVSLPLLPLRDQPLRSKTKHFHLLFIQSWTLSEVQSQQLTVRLYSPYSRWTMKGCLTSTKMSLSILVRTLSRTVEYSIVNFIGDKWWEFYLPFKEAFFNTFIAYIFPVSVPTIFRTRNTCRRWHRYLLLQLRPPPPPNTPHNSLFRTSLAQGPSATRTAKALP